MGIIRRAKTPPAAPIIRYRDVRPVVTAYLADPLRTVNHIVAAEAMFDQRASDPAESPLRQDDARQSIEVLHALQQMQNSLGAFDFHAAPPDQPKINLAGVEVSIRAELLVHGVARGGAHQIGGAVLRLTQDVGDSDAARDKRREMGLYVATMASRHIGDHFAGTRTVSNRLCMSIDVQHGEVFIAPPAVTRRMADMENACRFIAAMWESA